MIFTGGGGYTIENVSWCWTYETSLIAKEDIGITLPDRLEFSENFSSNKLHFGDSEIMKNNQIVEHWEYDKKYHPSYVVYNEKYY